jgi:hypothetical protein
MMRLYGYCEGEDEEAPVPLEEVTIVASPMILRRIATFLNYVADQMEKHGTACGHEHFQDFDKTIAATHSFPGVVRVN